MGSRSLKTCFKFIPLILFAAVSWTYFQPAIQIQISGVPASQWSAHQLAHSFYQGAQKALFPRQQPKMKVKLPASFFDFLEKLFPRQKHEPNVKAYAGLALSALIPVAFLLAYLNLLTAAVISLVPIFKKRRLFFAAAFFLAIYALAGTLFLQEQSDDIMRASVDTSSRGLFGLIAKSVAQQIGIQPGIALIGLPVLAAALWLLSALRKK